MQPSAEATDPGLIDRLPETRRERMIRLAVQLQELGVSVHLMPELLNYDLDLVEQQLIWLPSRKARKRASMIVAAIRGNYERPANYEA